MSSEELKPCLKSALRAMASNYANLHSHCWDHLDSETCNKAADELDALEAENARLQEDVKKWMGLAQSVQTIERITESGEARRAQLAAIQQAKGEEVEVVAHLMLPDFMEPYVSIRRDCSGVLVEPLGKISQFKRITAAMAAEVERLNDSVIFLGGELARIKEDRDALRAELAEVKGREAVGRIGASHGYKERFPIWNTPDGSEPPIGTKLYARPPASPDVEGLVSIEAARTQGGKLVGLRLTTTANGKTVLVFADQAAMPGFRAGDAFVEEPGQPLSYTALSTWRQAHELDS